MVGSNILKNFPWGAQGLLSLVVVGCVFFDHIAIGDISFFRRLVFRRLCQLVAAASLLFCTIPPKEDACQESDGGCDAYGPPNKDSFPRLCLLAKDLTLKPCPLLINVGHAYLLVYIFSLHLTLHLGSF